MTSASWQHAACGATDGHARIPQISFQRIAPAQSQYLCKISKQPLPEVPLLGYRVHRSAVEPPSADGDIADARRAGDLMRGARQMIIFGLCHNAE